MRDPARRAGQRAPGPDEVVAQGGGVAVQRRPGRGRQRRNAARVRGGHRRPAHVHPASTRARRGRNGAVDRRARCRDVDRRGTVVRGHRQESRVVRVRHRQHVRQVVAGGVGGLDVVVDTVVTRRRDDEHGRHRSDRRLQRGADVVAAPRCVDDLRAVCGRVRDRVDRLGVGPAGGTGGRAQELDRHDLHARRDARDPDAVASRRDRAGDVGPVPVVVGVVDGRVVVAEVPAVHVIGEAVPVVVLSIAGDLSGVDPLAAGEVGVGEIDPVVDDRHDLRRAAGRDLPGLWHVHVEVRRAVDAAEAEPGTVQAPQLREVGLADGTGECRAPVLRLDAEHLGAPRETRDGGEHLASLRRDDLGVDERQLIRELQPLGGPQRAALSDVHAGPIPDDEPSRRRRGGRPSCAARLADRRRLWRPCRARKRCGDRRRAAEDEQCGDEETDASGQWT